MELCLRATSAASPWHPPPVLCRSAVTTLTCRPRWRASSAPHDVSAHCSTGIVQLADLYHALQRGGVASGTPLPPCTVSMMARPLTGSAPYYVPAQHVSPLGTTPLLAIPISHVGATGRSGPAPPACTTRCSGRRSTTSPRRDSSSTTTGKRCVWWCEVTETLFFSGFRSCSILLQKKRSKGAVVVCVVVRAGRPGLRVAEVVQLRARGAYVVYAVTDAGSTVGWPMLCSATTPQPSVMRLKFGPMQ